MAATALVVHRTARAAACVSPGIASDDASCPLLCLLLLGHANRFDVHLLIESAVPVVEESRKRSGGAWRLRWLRCGCGWVRSGVRTRGLAFSSSCLRSDLHCGFVCACCVQRLVAAGSSVPTNEVGDERVVKTGADGQSDQKQGDEAEAEEEEEEQQQEDEVRRATTTTARTLTLTRTPIR